MVKNTSQTRFFIQCIALMLLLCAGLMPSRAEAVAVADCKAVKCMAGYVADPLTCQCKPTSGGGGTTGGGACPRGYAMMQGHDQVACIPIGSSSGVTTTGGSGGTIGSCTQSEISACKRDGGIAYMFGGACMCKMVGAGTGGTGGGDTCGGLACAPGFWLNTGTCTCEKQGGGSSSSGSCTPKACEAGTAWNPDACKCAPQGTGCTKAAIEQCVYSGGTMSESCVCKKGDGSSSSGATSSSSSSSGSSSGGNNVPCKNDRVTCTNRAGESTRYDNADSCCLTSATSNQGFCSQTQTCCKTGSWDELVNGSTCNSAQCGGQFYSTSTHVCCGTMIVPLSIMTGGLQNTGGCSAISSCYGTPYNKTTHKCCNCTQQPAAIGSGECNDANGCSPNSSGGGITGGQSTIYNAKGLQSVPPGYVDAQMQQLDTQLQSGAMTRQQYLSAQCDLSPNQAAYNSCQEAVTLEGDLVGGATSSSSSSSGGKECGLQSYCKALASSSYIFNPTQCTCAPAKPCSAYGCDGGGASTTNTQSYGNGTIISCVCETAGTGSSSGAACPDPRMVYVTASNECVYPGASSSGVGSGTSGGGCNPNDRNLCEMRGGLWHPSMCTCKDVYYGGSTGAGGSASSSSSNSSSSGGQCTPKDCPAGQMWSKDFCKCVSKESGSSSSSSSGSDLTCKTGQTKVCEESGKCYCKDDSGSSSSGGECVHQMCYYIEADENGDTVNKSHDYCPEWQVCCPQGPRAGVKTIESGGCGK